MGKYNYKDHVEQEENTPQLYFQFCIANELAEANRLKILEIKLHYHYFSKSDCKELDELEDKA